MMQTTSVSPFFESFLGFPNSLLQSACELFTETFRLQLPIIRRFPNLLFNRTFELVIRSFCFVLRTSLHGFSPKIRFAFPWNESQTTACLRPQHAQQVQNHRDDYDGANNPQTPTRSPS
jgi:hypothetical protein